MRMRKTILIAGFLIGLGAGVSGQSIYTLDASHVITAVDSGHFRMGNPGAGNQRLVVNSRYLTIGGMPWIPVMGELQYSRMPRERWAEEILKMKACGVTIISTYSFWNHHEEIEGEFDWSGNKDLRAFVQLCGQLGVLVYPRIGPWSHGEARNGGTPDWILRKKFIVDRSMDPVYQQYVERYFRQIGLQLKGLLYKDGGPVAGIQLENEYWKGKAGEPYIYWLKQTALRCGMDVPLYTVTGWGDGSIPKDEVIPLWGGYPDESWAPDIQKISSCDNYSFHSFRDDATIGNAQVKKKEGYDYSSDPYFTCELGVGIFNSIHRRPVIGALDGLALVASRIGSGGNLLGYYIFAGGSNPLGIYSTMEENKDETGYWSELSPISYDFQAAIRENGLPAPSYFEVKRMNYFLDEFGGLLAPMEPVFPARGDGLQYVARVKGNSGFLFGINYCRNNTRVAARQVRFQVKLKDRTLLFPSRPVDIPDSSLFVWPMGLDMEGVQLNYATAQPLFHRGSAFVFVQDADLLPEFSFEEAGVDKVVLQGGNGEVVRKDHAYIVSQLHPGSDCVIVVTRKDGSRLRIVVLSREEGRRSWILPDSAGREHFYLSGANLYARGNLLYMTDTVNDFEVKEMKDDGFTEVRRHVEEKRISAALRPLGALQEAQWLVTSVGSIDASNLLYHREFQKEFSAGDPARIESAKLVLAAESECRVRINDKWVDQPIKPGSLNVLDVTGYVQKGDNVLLMDFPFEAGERAAGGKVTGDRAFAARLLVEYFNTDRLDFSTDTSWLATDAYYFPATYGDKPVYPLEWAAPKVVGPGGGGMGGSAGRLALGAQALSGFTAWRLPIPCDYLDGLNNLYLDVCYQGDRISVRYNEKLIADNLNNNTDWLMDLKRGGYSLECQELEVEVRPWRDIGRMYFDRAPETGAEGKASIGRVRLVPEYRVSMSMSQ
jgi:beta-galactosidase